MRAWVLKPAATPPTPAVGAMSAATLEAMGFDRDAAQAAFVAAQGDMGQALDILTSQAAAPPPPAAAETQPRKKKKRKKPSKNNTAAAAPAPAAAPAHAPAPAAPAPAAAGGAGPALAKVERAKSGRSSCKRCKQPILKGTLRCGYETTSSWGKQMNWMHVDCFDFSAGTTKGDNPPGLSELDPQEQALIKSKLGTKPAKAAKAPAAKAPAAAAATAAAAPRKKPVTQLDEDNPRESSACHPIVLIKKCVKSALVRVSGARRVQDRVLHGQETCPVHELPDAPGQR